LERTKHKSYSGTAGTEQLHTKELIKNRWNRMAELETG
jgi:hypothetical protein